jgi:hypothetical protein
MAWCKPRRYVRSETEQQELKRLGALAKVPAFATLSEESLRALSQVCARRTIPPCTVIYQQGDAIDDLIIIQTGYVKLVRELESRRQRYRNAEFLPEAAIKPHWGTATSSPQWAHVKSPVKEMVAASRVRARLQRRAAVPAKPEIAISARNKVGITLLRTRVAVHQRSLAGLQRNRACNC